MKKSVHLFTIDAQNDFNTDTGPAGQKPALPVTGASEDNKRLAKFVERHEKGISEIWSTLDSHQWIHVAHPIMWVNSKGQHPNPFTVITKDDVANRVWFAHNPKWQGKLEKYVNELSAHDRYPLCIWPPHCLIGTWGHSLVPSVAEAFYNWEKNTFSRVRFVAKGSNLFTEHYSAVQADVPDDQDPSTKLNLPLIDAMANQADEILITGQALSHCVANTIRDIANNFGDDNIKKFVLLQDTSSSVTGYENLGQDFVKEMTKRGMQVTTTKDY